MEIILDGSNATQKTPYPKFLEFPHNFHICKTVMTGNHGYGKASNHKIDSNLNSEIEHN